MTLYFKEKIKKSKYLCNIKFSNSLLKQIILTKKNFLSILYQSILFKNEAKMEIEIRLEAILFNKENKLLLIEHEKNLNRYWVLPGGHLEPMEKFEQCLIRELEEELSVKNLKVSDLSFVDEYINKEKNRHVVKIGFICKAEEKELLKIKIPENEKTIKNYKFFSSSEILLSMEKFYPDKLFFIELINKFKNGEKNG